MCQAIQTTPIQPQLEQSEKPQKTHNQVVSPTLPQEPKTACQTLRKRLYLLGLVVWLGSVRRSCPEACLASSAVQSGWSEFPLVNTQTPVIGLLRNCPMTDRRSLGSSTGLIGFAWRPYLFDCSVKVNLKVGRQRLSIPELSILLQSQSVGKLLRQFAQAGQNFSIIEGKETVQLGVPVAAQ